MRYKQASFVVFFIVFIITVSLFSIYYFYIINKTNSISAVNGEVDLSGYDFSNDDIVYLNGEWEFYWKKHVMYSDIVNKRLEGKMYIYAPSVWNSYMIDNQKLPGSGYGTYRLRIRGIPAGTNLSLRVSDQAGAYSIYIDDKLLCSNGLSVTSASTAIYRYDVITASFVSESNDFNLIIHVSNFIYARGGLWSPVIIGKTSTIEKLHKNIIYKDMFLIGTLFIIGAYYLIIYMMNKKDNSYLYLSILCFLAILRVSLYGDNLIANLFPGISVNIVSRMDYITIYLCSIVFLKFIAWLFSEEFCGKMHKYVMRFITFYTIVMTVITIFTSVAFFTNLIGIIQIVLVALILYILTLIIVAFIRKRKNSGIIIFATALLALCLFHDILYHRNVVSHSAGEISAAGVFVFIGIQSYILAKRFSSALADSVSLNLKLIDEEKLKDRIRQTEIAFLQSQIKPHFLFNALNSIDAYCDVDPKEASRLIGSLSTYLRHSFDFDNLEASVSIQREISYINAYLDIEKARFDNLQVYYELDYKNNFSLPPLMIQPLVENAIRHGIRGKSSGGVVSIKITEDKTCYHISVEDNGIGISQDKLSTILNQDNKSGGVGLTNIHCRLMYLYNKGLTISSEINKGTMVSFSIPKGGINNLESIIS